MVESSHPDWWLGKYLVNKYLPNLLCMLGMSIS